MTHPRMFRRAASTLLVASATVAACGGGGSKTAATTTAAATTVAATTSTSSTVAATTSTSSTAAATTTTAVPVPTFPLTGLPATDPAVRNRPAVVVKVNNVSSARPQFGINEADMVFEEKIGDAVTRLFTVFQSRDADKVGSIRSARASDLPLVAALAKPLLVWSGNNENLAPAIAKADITDAGYSRHSDLYTRGRLLPDYTEFFVSTAEIRTLAPEGQGAPPALFAYRAASDPAPTGQAVKGATWKEKSYVVTWTWDPAKGVWLRDQSGTPHTDAAGVQVGPPNVVLMEVRYKAAFDDPRSPEAVTVGTGAVTVLVNGVAVTGTWERAKDTDPFLLKDATGKVIALTPGTTWIELTNPDTVELAS